MLSKKEIKDIQSLSHKKFRKELKLFIAEGPKIVSELWQLIPSQFERIYATGNWEGHASDDITVMVTDQELEKISELKTPNQVLAVIRQFENYEPECSGLTLYLDAIQDPGNLGTIIRIADWFNIGQVVCNGGCADMYNPKVIQSTMASMARVHVYYDEDGSWLSKQQVPIYAATLDGSNLRDQPKIKEGILVIGNESRGISEQVMKLATKKITIPKTGNAESLNAAVATGIILYELTQ